jgi:ABC-type molybdate transport system substrate-binding protein
MMMMMMMIIIIVVVVVVVVVVVSCHRPYLPGTFPEATVIPTAHASSFRL